jgi:hypothetical protein
MDDEPKGPVCECNWPRRAVTDKAFPVTYDKEMGEFQLVLDFGEQKGNSLLRYCPWCDGNLPKSKRGSFFTVPSESEMADVVEKMRSVRIVVPMYDVLGEPSDLIDDGWRVQYNYDHLYDSLVLVVFQQKEPITYLVQGKHKS